MNIYIYTLPPGGNLNELSDMSVLMAFSECEFKSTVTSYLSPDN